MPADKCGTVSLPMLALISVRPPPSGYCAHHRRSPHQGHAWCGACSPTLTMLGPVPLILFSRFANLETFKIPPLTFGHTMPAIAYTSGMFSLPSAARVEAVRPSRVLLGFQGSAGGCASDSLTIAHSGASCQAFQPVFRLAHSAMVRRQ
jgi:hypothetical protein